MAQEKILVVEDEPALSRLLQVNLEAAGYRADLAPDGETAFRVSLLSRENGALTAESWPAVAYPEFLGIADAVEGRPG